MGETTSTLADMLQLAEWGPRQLVAAINGRLSSQGRERLRLDPTAAYPWVRRGFRPHPPIPDVAARVLSERLGLDVTTAQLWPNHRSPADKTLSAADLDSVSHISDLLQELTHLNTVATTPQSPIKEASGVDLSVAVHDQLRSAVLIARKRTGHEFVLPEQVDLIVTHVAALRRLDDRSGGGTLSLRYVTAELRSIIDLFEHGNYDVPIGRRLLTVIADLAQLLGWLHFDSSRYGPAQRYLLLSVGACRALGAADRAANAIGMLSYVSALAGHGRQAVHLAEAAVREAGACPPVVQARLLGRSATAAAADGDVAKFRCFSQRAAELLERGGQDDVPPFLYYLNPAQLAAETGHSLVVLAGQTTAGADHLLEEAVGTLTRAVTTLAEPGASGTPLYARSALLHSTFLIHAHLLRGDVKAAVSGGRTAIGLLPLVQSPRGRDYLRTLRPALARRSRSRLVAEFLPDFDAALSLI